MRISPVDLQAKKRAGRPELFCAVSVVMQGDAQSGGERDARRLTVPA
ncbi:MAG: hypothetical protein AB7F41_15545 [Methylocystis sp.]